MNNYRNNRKNRFKSNGDRNFRKRSYGHKTQNDLIHSEFRHRNPEETIKMPKLIDKYNNLAREALSSGDKILSENYLQHADHFSRILSLQELNKNQSESNNVIEQDFKSDIKTLSSEKEKDNNNLNTSNKVD